MSDEDDCQIIEDNTNYKSITCEKIPELFLDKLIAKKHFGKFGKITRFVLRPNRFCCTVDYEREEEAANALENGAVFNGHEFIIRYAQREVGHVQNTEEWVDPDVQAELDAMGNHPRRLPQTQMPKPVASTTRAKQKPARSAPDPQPSTVPKVSSAARSELEAILRKPAYTDEDKYRILDARDKLIRLTTVRTTDINKVVSIKGTCPDMCPEKERFMREFQHQVSAFEMEEGGNRNEMNHSIAVKEYSRSSADQEVPLTHELRPEPVLKMTMLYLMHRIMGLCDVDDVNIGDWFHFVWDRTRSVRKDITQQELCSTGAVELVEQCARFHIHCAARLVAEDPSVFDQKINTENLTKCLQTLKYMYNDLRIKGIRCEREAEFRGYIVLLNLNDANFLWELQELPEEIQHSEEVRSAINFYKCMESNNYVRFFNLLRETTYMNACILLRYFTQVRLKALRMIIKAYNWPRHLVSLPLNYLMKILGFENADAAVDFFSYYGLECDQDTVRLDKNAFEEPDVPVLMERAFELVESKRQVGVGEAVCGHPLESPDIFENHQPHNSFDSNGYLRYESFTADDQVKEEGHRKTPPRTTADTVFKVPAPSPPLNPKLQLKSIFASTSAKTEPESKAANVFGQPASQAGASIFSQKPATVPVTTSIFKIPIPSAPAKATANTAAPLFSGSVFEQNSKPSNGSIAQGSNIFGKATDSFAADNIFQHFNTTPFEMKPPMPGPDLAAQEKEKEKERLKQLEEEKRRKLAEERRRNEEEEQERQRKLAEERQRQQQLEEKRHKTAVARVTEASELVLKDLLNEVQQEQISHIASKELQDHRRIEKLAENVIFEYISEFIQKIQSEELSIMQRDQSLLHKYFHSWRELAHKMKSQRKLVSAMPLWMTADTLDQQAEKIAHPRQVENLQLIKRYRLGLPCDFRRLLDEEEDGTPIDLFDILRRQFSAQQHRSPTGFLKRRKYFKLIISIPGERDELPGFNSYTTSWLTKNTKRRQSESSPAFLCHCDDDLALCVRTVSCITSKNEQNQKVTSECDHADALLFLMSPGNSVNSRKRLHHLLKLSTINRPVPVAVVMYSPPSAANIDTILDLKPLIEDGQVSSFHVFPSNDQRMKSDFQRALQFLAKSDEYELPLESQNVVSFLDVCIGSELWRKLHRSWCTNPSFRKICSIPRLLVVVYNEAVSRLAQIIDEDFQDYPDFPEELRQFAPQSLLDIPVGIEQFPKDWKDVENTRKLIGFVEKLRLPPITEAPPQEIDDLEVWLMNYTSKCIPDSDNAASTAGLLAIKYLIEEMNQPDLEDIPVDERLPFISWLPIIQQIALAVLNHQWSCVSGEISRSVIYNREEFHEFQSNPWWLESDLVKSVKMVHEAEGGAMTETESTADIDEVIARAEKVSADAEGKLLELKREANAVKIDPDLTRELDETLYSYEVNEKCRSFEGAVGGSVMEEEDSLEMPPVTKKFKGSPDQMNVNEIMERAFAILKKAEGFVDSHRMPLKEIEISFVE